MNTIERFLVKNRKREWFRPYNSKCTHVSLKFINATEEIGWSYYALSFRPDITPWFIDEYESYGLDWECMALHMRKWETLYASNPELPWDWFHINCLAPITTELLGAHPDWPWDYRYISINRTITPELIDAHITEDWDWYEMGFLPNLTPAFIQKYIDKDWGWHDLSENPAVTAALVRANIEKPWVFTNLSWVLDDYSLILELPDRDWDMDGLSANTNVTESFAQANRGLGWNWSLLSKNKAITCPFIEELIDLPWDWSAMSANPNLTLQFVEKYIDRPWDWEVLSGHSCITIEIVKAHSSIRWWWGALAANPNLPCDFIINNGDSSLWKGLSRHPNLTPELIIKYADKPWHWEHLTINPAVTLDLIEKLPQGKWDMVGLDEVVFDRVMREEKAIETLKRIRAHNRTLRIPHRYKLTKLIKTRAFCEWWYAPDNVGGRVAKARISGAIGLSTEVSSEGENVLKDEESLDFPVIYSNHPSPFYTHHEYITNHHGS